MSLYALLSCCAVLLSTISSIHSSGLPAAADQWVLLSIDNRLFKLGSPQWHSCYRITLAEDETTLCAAPINESELIVIDQITNQCRLVMLNHARVRNAGLLIRRSGKNPKQLALQYFKNIDPNNLDMDLSSLGEVNCSYYDIVDDTESDVPTHLSLAFEEPLEDDRSIGKKYSGDLVITIFVNDIGQHSITLPKALIPYI